jgi:exopolyphosphatase / guanosine-5'-triphosphate,3'-diphosphate pyrophosphatase
VTRVAVVDIGTNSTRLLVADVSGASVEELDRRLAITRLGEGVDSRRRLLPTAIARVRNVLVDYRRAADELGAERTLALATSAIRDAENGEAFLGELEWSYGFETRLLSGHEEALLTFRGVASGRTIAESTLVVDVGGGSTELILGGPGGVSFHTSLDVGCVRLTERFLYGDPPTAVELEACRAHARELLHAAVPSEVTPTTALGVAGTVTTLATLELGLEEEVPALVHGHKLPAQRVDQFLGELGTRPLSELRELPGLHPERAPVIVAGVVVVLEILRHFGLDELEASERDIMHGGALAAAELSTQVEGDAPPGAYTCC